MSLYKVVRDSAGRCRGCGPNNDNFAPVIPAGGSIETSETFVPVDPTPEEQAQEQRIAIDHSEAEAARVDTQIQSDLNMTPAEVNNVVDTIFASWTAPQRTFMKRLVRMVLAAARKVLR